MTKYSRHFRRKSHDEDREYSHDKETIRQASAIIQLFKYGIVGALNTLLTLVVIFFCKSLLNLNPYVSNAIGYFVGLVNSFIWNRIWVFKASDGSIKKHAMKFLAGAGICYLLQLAVVWVLNQSTFGNIRIDLAGFVLSGYGIATLIGMVVYTLSNFLFNRVVTFK